MVNETNRERELWVEVLALRMERDRLRAEVERLKAEVDRWRAEVPS